MFFKIRIRKRRRRYPKMLHNFIYLSKFFYAIVIFISAFSTADQQIQIPFVELTTIFSRNTTAYHDALQRMKASAANFTAVCGRSTLKIEKVIKNSTFDPSSSEEEDAPSEPSHYRIISGKKAKNGQFPWLLALRARPFTFSFLPMSWMRKPWQFAHDNKLLASFLPKFHLPPLPKLIFDAMETKGWMHFCGGTLVSDEWLVTAAHCIVPAIAHKYPPQYAVTAGTTRWVEELSTLPSTNATAGGSAGATMAEIYVHPLYIRDTYTHDIALVRLKHPLPIVTDENNTTASESSIRPICLPSAVTEQQFKAAAAASSNSSSSEDANLFGIIAGWGVKHEISHKNMNKRLRFTSVKIIHDTHACEQKLQTDIVREAAICAGNIHDQVDQMTVRDACQGDSGGPLATFDVSKQRWSLSGIVSFGIGCGRIGMPSIYTNVSHYLAESLESLSNVSRRTGFVGGW